LAARVEEENGAARPKFKSLWKEQKNLLFIMLFIAFAWNFTGAPYLLSWTQFLFYLSLYPAQALQIGTVTAFNIDLPQNYCVLFGGLIFLSTLLGGALIDKLGRKYCTIVGLFVCFISMLIICILGYAQKESYSGSNQLNGNYDSYGTVTMYCIWASGFGLWSVGAFTFLLDVLTRKGWAFFMGKFFFIFFLLQLTAWDIYESSSTAINTSAPNGTKVMGLYCCVIMAVLIVPIWIFMKETKAGVREAHDYYSIGGNSAKVANQAKPFDGSQQPILGNTQQEPINVGNPIANA